MTKYSIITCVSDADVYRTHILDSRYLDKRLDIEVIPINNTNKLYSASQALNIGIDAANGQYLIMTHQDIYLKTGFFDKLDQAIAKIPSDWSILGAAGIDLSVKRNDISEWGGALVGTTAIGQVYANLADDMPYWDGSIAITPVHCIDECLFIINKAKRLRFDNAFNGFHFYGVDLSLQARSENHGVYCCGLPIVHNAKYSGSMSGPHGYWPHLRYLHRKWCTSFPEVLGTHFHWSNAELTSYVPMTLVGDRNVGIKAMGVSQIKLNSDDRFFRALSSRIG